MIIAMTLVNSAIWLPLAWFDWWPWAALPLQGFVAFNTTYHIDKLRSLGLWE